MPILFAIDPKIVYNIHIYIEHIVESHGRRAILLVSMFSYNPCHMPLRYRCLIKKEVN